MLVELVIAKLLVVTIGMLFVLYSLYGGSMYNERSIRETDEQ